MLKSLVVALAGLQAILPLANATASTSTNVHCYTSSGHSSCKHVPTHSSTTTHRCTVDITKTSTPTVTTTPKPTTVTVHKTSTSTITLTASQNTDTFTTTSTSTVTSASTTTEVDISTTTTTTTTVSTPVASSPAPAGFTPIASEPAIIAANGPANRRRSRSERHSKITVEREAAGKAKTNVDPNAQKVKAVNGQPQCPKDLYPESVSCIKRVEVIETSTHTATAKSKITKTLPRKTSTVSATSTVKVTSTAANPDASTTVTETTTTTATPLVTQTSTSVTTLTSTSTSYAPATTSYADCQANNLISQVSGNPINAIQFEFDLKVSGNSDSDLDCCIQCHDSDKCGGFAYMSNLCYQFTGPQGGAVCDGSMEAFGFLTSTDDDPAYTIGNGGCGQGRFHGIDD